MVLAGCAGVGAAAGYWLYRRYDEAWANNLVN